MNLEHPLQTTEVLIIGAGPAGYNAALYASRAGLECLILTGLLKGGQLTLTDQVDNWLGMNHAKPTEMLDLMEAHATAYGGKIKTDTVLKLEKNEGGWLAQGEQARYQAKVVIVATGASAKYLGLPSEQAFMGRGVSACATCDGFFYKNKPVAVIGGGNSALEEAIYLSKICSHVTLIHRKDSFRGEHILQEHLLKQVEAGKISLKTPYVLKEVLGDQSGVTGALIQHTNDTGTEEKLTVDGIFIAIGHQPNTQFLDSSFERDEFGFLRKGHETFQAHLGTTATSVPGVFAAGDVADPIYRQAITAAAMGCQAALDAAAYIRTQSPELKS